MNSKIQNLDANFRSAAVQEETSWHNVQECPFPAVEGVAWPDESDAFCRLPQRAREVVTSDVWALSRMSAGLLVRFQSDAPTIAARWQLLHPDAVAMPHMAATGVSGLDLYVQNNTQGGTSWHWLAVARPDAVAVNEVVLVKGLEPAPREYALYLPLYNGLTQLEIGVSGGASL